MPMNNFMFLYDFYDILCNELYDSQGMSGKDSLCSIDHKASHMLVSNPCFTFGFALCTTFPFMDCNYHRFH
jgi:hypothetical protein